MVKKKKAVKEKIKRLNEKLEPLIKGE